MNDWNIYSPLWAPVELDGKWLKLSDKDPFDYAKAERVIPATKELKVEFDLQIAQTDHGQLNIEFLNDCGDVCSKIIVDGSGMARVKGGARYATLIKKVEAGKTYHVEAVLSARHHNTQKLRIARLV